MAPWGKAAGPSGAVTSDAGTPYAAGGGAAAAAGSAAGTPKLRKETRSQCCCCHVARGLLLALVSLFLLGSLGTSVASLALGPDQTMTRYKSAVELDASSLAKFAESGDNLIKLAKAKNGGPALDIRTGYLAWKDGNAADQGKVTLKDLGKGPWIIGYVLLAMLLLSIVAAFIGLLSACCCGCSGCGLATFAIPFGLALLGTLLAYWIIVWRAVDRYAHDAYPVLDPKSRVFQVPGWAWYLGLISSGLWLLAGSVGCCMPKRTKTVTTLA